jgi:predicted DNA-binding transcriptional regulator AlpA
MSEVIVTTPEQLEALIEKAVKNAVRSKAEDRLMDPQEVAKLLSVSEDWLYHNAHKLPFTRKLGRRLLRFSYQGMLKYIDSKKLASVKGET